MHISLMEAALIPLVVFSAAIGENYVVGIIKDNTVFTVNAKERVIINERIS